MHSHIQGASVQYRNRVNTLHRTDPSTFQIRQPRVEACAGNAVILHVQKFM